MITGAFFLMIGVVVGLVIGARLKSPQIWGAGFVAGAFAGMALASRALMGVFNVGGRRNDKGAIGRKGQMLSWLWDRLQGQRGQKQKIIRSMPGVRGANVHSGRRWN